VSKVAYASRSQNAIPCCGSVENKTFRELTNLDLKYVIFFTQERLGLKADPSKRE
jgi:hypothetical protein